MFFSKTRQWKNNLILTAICGAGLVVVPFLPWFKVAGSSAEEPRTFSLEDAAILGALALLAAGAVSVGIALALLSDNTKAQDPRFVGGLAAAGVVALSTSLISVLSPPAVFVAVQTEPILGGITAPAGAVLASLGPLSGAYETFAQGRREMQAQEDLGEGN